MASKKNKGKRKSDNTYLPKEKGKEVKLHEYNVDYRRAILVIKQLESKKKKIDPNLLAVNKLQSSGDWGVLHMNRFPKYVNDECVSIVTAIIQLINNSFVFKPSPLKNTKRNLMNTIMEIIKRN